MLQANTVVKQKSIVIQTSPAFARCVVEISGEPFHTFYSPHSGTVYAAGFALPDDPEAYSITTRLSKLNPAIGKQCTEAKFCDTGAVADTLRAYADGDFAALDNLTVTQPETPFRGDVWRALRTVPAGTTVTYSELATLSGRPSAIRAAASACANNLVALIVPCHRIVRSDGGLGGYLFGTELKQKLLQAESAVELRR